MTKNILLTTRKIELIGKKEFTIATLDLKHKSFVIHIAALNINTNNEMHPLKKAQIAH